MKRILCIVGGMNAGGAETFLMKLYRTMDRTKYQMDFCVASEDKGFYDDEILKLGGRIIHTVPKTKGFIQSFCSIRKIVKENQYQYVMRISQNSLSAMELLAAKFGGAKYVVFRSSNSGTGSGAFGEIIHKFFKFLTILVPDIKIAPSTEAAEFMFGKRDVKKGNVTILHNAIDTKQFLFQEEKRKKIRKELGIEDEFVVGHVGRFNHQKNHEFLLEIFSRIKEKREDVLLLLVGDGELKEKIQNRVKELNLENAVRFLGIRSDVPDLMSVLDVLLFPSFYEGMPNVVIESQASGLPCVISDTITKEADITGLVEYLPLSKSADFWAEQVLLYADGFERFSRQNAFLDAGYDIASATQQFVDLVFERE